MSGRVDHPRRALAELTQCHQPIGLTELYDTAGLLTRIDRKYLVGIDQLPGIIAAVAAPVCVLEIDGERTFPYRSTYFDTPELISYQQSARRRPRRFKVRTRSYVATSRCWVEAKLRQPDGRTAKSRVEHDVDHEIELTATARQFLAEFAEIAPHLDALAPSLTTCYQRATLACGQRVTLDVDLSYQHPAGTRLARFGADANLVIVETKSADHRPGPFDRALWASGARPATVSKYGIGVAAAHPALPANKWHRWIARHLERVDTPTPGRCPRRALPRDLVNPRPRSNGDLR